ncbi:MULTISPECIES: hypothetical protein [Burkholderia]|uniref:hypothetical protein n=1 Tax=Burkholderia TaxID=32008 RepID=UPI0012E3D435|nr:MULTISPECIES: hypothetical protein [Burkholderia]
MKKPRVLRNAGFLFGGRDPIPAAVAPRRRCNVGAAAARASGTPVCSVGASTAAWGENEKRRETSRAMKTGLLAGFSPRASRSGVVVRFAARGAVRRAIATR